MSALSRQRAEQLMRSASTSWHAHNPALATFTAEGEV